MTVSTTDNNVVYRGNGAATQWAVPFKVLDVDHLIVQRRVFATGALDHTYVGTEFTYSGLGASSGTLTLNGAALSNTYELVIDRIVPYTQALDIVNAGGFYPDTVEEQLDLIVMSIQQLADLVGRTPKAGIDDPGLVIPPAQTLIGSNRVLGTDGITGQLALLAGSAFKGDPGGNIMAIGLKTASNGMEISAGTTRIFTTGYSSVNRGAALYGEVATVRFNRGGLLTNGSAVVTGLSRTDDLTVGATVTGTTVPLGATIASIDSASQVTLSAALPDITTVRKLTFTMTEDETVVDVIKLNGTVTSNSAIVTDLKTTVGLVVGAAVTGPGIAAGTTLLSIDSTTQVTLSAVATLATVRSLAMVTPLNAAYATAHANVVISAALGRYFLIDTSDQFITPTMFGCIGDNATDDAVPLQDFFTFIYTHSVRYPFVAGNFYTTAGITIGDGKTQQATARWFGGQFGLRGAAGIEVLLTVDNSASARFEGRWILRGAPNGTAFSYANRAVGVGLYVKDSRLASFEHIYGAHFWFAAQAIDSAPNNNFLNFETIEADACGSGDSAAGMSLTSTVSSVVNSGADSSVSQYTTLTVATLPPASLSTYSGGIGATGPTTHSNNQVRMGSNVYTIIGWDRAASTIRVFPRVRASDAGETTITYIYGGASHWRGSDANVGKVGRIDAGANCGAALVVASLYGPVVSVVSAQSCGQGMRFGREPGGACKGSVVHAFYPEGLDEQLVFVSRFGGAFTGSVQSEYALDWSRIKTCGYALDASDVPTYTAIDDWTIWYRGNTYRGMGVGTGATQTLNGTGGHAIFTHAAVTITLTQDSNRARLLNWNRGMVTVMGSAADGLPTSVVFAVPTGGTLNGTLNGTVTYNTFTKVPSFVYRNTVAAGTSGNVWIVAQAG